MKKCNIRKSDMALNGITYLASLLCVLILLSVFVFTFSKGSSLINWDLLKNDYWSKNYIVESSADHNTASQYEKPDDLSHEAYFSRRWGIALVDHVSHEKEKQVLIEYIDPISPFASVVDGSAGQNKGKELNLQVGMRLEKIDFEDQNGTAGITGTILSENAETVVKNLDQTAETLTSAYVKTAGGGIRGSIIATGYLILVSLLIALPIGIAAAIYLNEYATKNRVNQLIRTGIEMLTGVPSIIYGLMGVTVLFPITKAFGATTTNVLLGGITMSIILLPTIIRATEEALLVVPQNLRDASLALGANQSQTIFKIILPCAVPGILSGVLLSIGRVIGESAALIYTMGTFISDAPTLLTQGTSMAVHIWSIMSGEQPNFELASAISIILLIFVFLLNIGVKWISRRLQKEWH
ncbi:MAG: phosphate ABC transporter permease PstA [Erysipelotrichaceae bacterium]|nr:phosphate ABC transporter permease PstA [Erysipelotrichaceae bacterium]